MNHDASTILRLGLRELAVPEPDRVQTLLERYLDEVERWNPRFGLIRAADRRELVIRHVLDSLAAWRQLQEEVPLAGRAAVEGEPRGSVLDVGSGAGLPGIPLAVALPHLAFTLMERMARRASFLKASAALLGLSGVMVEQTELARATGRFDVVTFRAMAPLERFLSDLRRSRIRWGVVAAYKGREDRARQEMEEAARGHGAGLRLRFVPLEVPFLGEERCLIVASPQNTVRPGEGLPPDRATRKGLVR